MPPEVGGQNESRSVVHCRTWAGLILRRIEATREFDKRASLMGRPVNFPRNSNEGQTIKKRSRSKMEFVEEDGKLDEQTQLNEQLKEARKKDRQPERPFALSVSATKLYPHLQASYTNRLKFRVDLFSTQVLAAFGGNRSHTEQARKSRRLDSEGQGEE